MKRRRFISFVFVLILCFGMSGCGKEKKTTAPNKFQSESFCQGGCVDIFHITYADSLSASA